MKNVKESKRSHIVAEFLKKTKKVLFCRICGGKTFCVIDLGCQPFANALEAEPHSNVQTYPLKMHVCEECSTGQLSYCADSSGLYKNYLYVSPVSSILDRHFKDILDFLKEHNYVHSASNILEIGSNVGSFLKFIKPHVNSILGVDPAVNISKMANDRGVPTLNGFFNGELAEDILSKQGKKDVIIARHCFAHNEKPGLMLEGIQKLLSEDGVLLIENSYLLDIAVNIEVDQIYHEHMYFYNLRSISKIFDRYGFKLVDVKYSSVHGGSILYVGKFKDSRQEPSRRVYEFLGKEKDMHRESFYTEFISKIERNKKELCELVQQLKSQGKTIHIYGASAKSTMLLNYYQLDKDIAPFIIDSTKIKQGKYIPKVNIKVISEEEGAQNPPDYYLLTIWNYKDEIIRKVRALGNNKSKFILPHPEVRIIE